MNIADHPKSVGFPAHPPAIHSFLGAPVRAMGKVFGNLYLAEKRGAATFSRDDEESLVILATQAGVAIAKPTLSSAMHIRERWLVAVGDINADMLVGAEADSQLRATAATPTYTAV